MSTLISAQINIDKIDKSKLKNGKYFDVLISINDQTDDYGNNVSLTENQSEEQRKADEKKNYIGNGRVFWTKGAPAVAEKREKKTHSIETNSQGAENDLPF